MTSALELLLFFVAGMAIGSLLVKARTMPANTCRPEHQPIEEHAGVADLLDPTENVGAFMVEDVGFVGVSLKEQQPS